jgi:hypothetical protein
MEGESGVISKIWSLILLEISWWDEPNDGKKIINDNGSGSHEQPTSKWALTSLDDLCDLLRLLFVIFFDVVRFISSRSFQWYMWCHQRGFDMSLNNLLSFVFLLYLFIVICKERGKRKMFKNIKWSWSYIETSIMTLRLSFERF